MSTITGYKIKQMSPQLQVADLDRSLEFYTQQLGFTIDFRYEDFYAGIIKDGYSIHLKSSKPSIEERTNKKKNEDLDIVFSIDNIEELFEELSNREVDIIQPIRTMAYGKEFYIEDPDGYIISFLEGS